MVLFDYAKDVFSKLSHGIEEAKYFAINKSYLMLTDLAISTTFIAFLTILIAGQRLINICGEERGTRVRLLRGTISALIIPLCLVWIGGVVSALFTTIILFFAEPEVFQDIVVSWEQNHTQWIVTLVGSLVVGSLGRYWVAKRLEPKVNTWIVAAYKTSSAKSRLTDVRDISNKKAKNFTYDPSKHIDRAKKVEAIFLGLGADNFPVLIPFDVFRRNHTQFMGPPGTGKTVEATNIGCQVIGQGGVMIVIDPKNDEWAPHVYKQECEAIGKPFKFVDLRNGKSPQLNPLQGANRIELNELLVAALGLGRKGEASDYYRQNERKALRILTQQFDSISLSDITCIAPEVLDKELFIAAGGMLDQINELAAVTSIQTNDNSDLLAEVIRTGGCVYIVGSMRDEAVLMLQKLLLVRLVQIIENRERGGRHVSIFLDEIKYLLSAQVINAFGTIRDKGANFLLAHQSLADLEQCGGDINGKTARNQIIDNTQLKWIYRTKDFEAASWASQQTGKIIIDTESREVIPNEADIGILESTIRINQNERFLFDTNVVQNLADGCALFIGWGLAKLAYTAPIPTNKESIEPIKAIKFEQVVEEELLL